MLPTAQRQEEGDVPGALVALQDLGLHRATDVVGGYHAWARAGLPVHRPGRAVDRSGPARAP